MLLLRGPIKLDFIFSEPHIHEQPWRPEPSNLAAIDCHFWDWALWLRSKQLASKSTIVASELHAMFGHLLQPMGVEVVPMSLDAAVVSYVSARDRLEGKFGVAVSRALEAEVRPALNEQPLSGVGDVRSDLDSLPNAPRRTLRQPGALAIVCGARLVVRCPSSWPSVSPKSTLINICQPTRTHGVDETRAPASVDPR